VVSHYHGDHYGQADSFRAARLVIGKGDAEELRKDKTAIVLAPWLGGSRPSVQISSDLDLFGNGSVVALFTPGHTPGHLSLFVRVGAKSYILTGDAVHSRGQLAARRPSGNHVDKVKGVQSIDRLNRLAATTGATIIVGHDKGDLGLLPAFPKGVTAK
jgi:glyoxylase-like metal-dependent hydrolase (beta-lactamase superfamily II)